MLSDAERAAIAAEPERFLAHWTLKEAYAKATGLGLHSELRRLTIDLDRGVPGWQVTHLRPTPVHHLAVALRPRRDLRMHWL